jgi:hypothetical protein
MASSSVAPWDLPAPAQRALVESRQRDFHAQQKAKRDYTESDQAADDRVRAMGAPHPAFAQTRQRAAAQSASSRAGDEQDLANSRPPTRRDRAYGALDEHAPASGGLSKLGGTLATPPWRWSASDGTGALLGVLLWMLGLNYLRDGPVGVKDFLLAKLFNKQPDGTFFGARPAVDNPIVVPDNVGSTFNQLFPASGALPTTPVTTAPLPLVAPVPTRVGP